MKISEIYLSTVCLDRNRWGSRKPSVPVSTWLPRISSDGFDGVELWGYHYNDASADERAALEDASNAISIFNSYAGFEEQDTDARTRDAAAAKTLGAKSIKYNVGNTPEHLDLYKKNLLAWAEQVPEDCTFLCECHPGTILEHTENIEPFFESLPADRFKMILHVSGGPATQAQLWLDQFSERICHLHVQMRGQEFAPPAGDSKEMKQKVTDPFEESPLEVTASIEFSRGIGRDENTEEIYNNAVLDLRRIKSWFS